MLIAYYVRFSLNCISVEAGAQSARSPAEVAAGANSIVTMLPNNSIVSSVYQGEEGIFSTLREGSLLVDSSTVDPALSKELASVAAGRGCRFVDAPVSGQSEGRRSKTRSHSLIFREF